MKPSTDEAFKQICKAAVVKRSLGKVNQALKKGIGCCSDIIVAAGRVGKMLEQLVVVAFGSDLRSQRPLPNANWAQKVFSFSIYGSNPGTAEANWPSFGLMQVNIVLSGDITFACIPTDRVPGSTYAEKRGNVLRMTVDDVTKIVGFYAKFVDGVGPAGECGLVIPSGFMVLCASSSARVLRWSLMADEADTVRVRDTLVKVLESFPEMRQPDQGYEQFAAHLGVQAPHYRM